MLDPDHSLESAFPGPLTLTRLTSADAAAFSLHLARDLERLGEHLAWPANAATPAGAERWLARYEQREEGRVLAAGAWSGPTLIGGAVLFHHEEQQGTIEIGCWVVAEGEGRGVAFGACRALLALARADLHVERVEWRAGTRNARSRRLAERLGFRHEGTLRSSYAVRGSRVDSDVLSVVGTEIDNAISA